MKTTVVDKREAIQHTFGGLAIGKSFLDKDRDFGVKTGKEATLLFTESGTLVSWGFDADDVIIPVTEIEINVLK